VGVVASSCGLTVNPGSEMSPETRCREDQGYIVGLDVKSFIVELFMFSSLKLSLLNFEHFMFN
jgi:hypothetical protein